VKRPVNGHLGKAETDDLEPAVDGHRRITSKQARSVALGRSQLNGRETAPSGNSDSIAAQAASPTSGSMSRMMVGTSIRSIDGLGSTPILSGAATTTGSWSSAPGPQFPGHRPVHLLPRPPDTSSPKRPAPTQGPRSSVGVAVVNCIVHPAGDEGARMGGRGGRVEPAPVVRTPPCTDHACSSAGMRPPLVHQGPLALPSSGGESYG
jgi:hypothetical protein